MPIASRRSGGRWFVASVGPRVETAAMPGLIREGWRSPRKRAVLERKLTMLDNAHTLLDLRAPPGNRLEALKRDLAGKHSIRVNDQFRIIFTWTDAGPVGVVCDDYHS
jgi:toxin HigB-1